MKESGKLSIYILSGFTIFIGFLVIVIACCKSNKIENTNPSNPQSSDILDITLETDISNEDKEEDIMVMMTFENRDFEETDL